MTARESLALAHERMTPAEIAEHALGLAALVESQAMLIARYEVLTVSMRGAIAALEKSIQLAQRSAKLSLAAFRRKDAAVGRRRLLELSERSMSLGDDWSSAFPLKPYSVPDGIFSPAEPDEGQPKGDRADG